MTRNTGRSDLVDIDATIIHETEKAYLLDAGGSENVWVQKSKVEHDPSDNTFAMSEDYALEKGLI